MCFTSYGNVKRMSNAWSAIWSGKMKSSLDMITPELTNGSSGDISYSDTVIGVSLDTRYYSSVVRTYLIPAGQWHWHSVEKTS